MKETITLPDGTTHFIDEEVPVPEELENEVSAEIESDNLELPELEYDDDIDAEEIFSAIADELPEDDPIDEPEPQPEKIVHSIPLERIKALLTSDEIFYNGARIALGLTFLTVSAMSFMPYAASIILGLVAIALCGLPVFLQAYERLKDGRYLSEELLISAAALLTVIVGYVADGVFSLIIADIGFILRDNVFNSLRDEAEEALQDKSSEGDKQLLNRKIALINALYTPALIIIAIIIIVISVVATGSAAGEWIHRALLLVIAACPCAAALVTALNFDFGNACAKKNGLFFSDIQSIRNTAQLTSVIFNKTGTVTEGNYKVTGVYPVNLTEAQLLYLAAYAEAFSEHPLAKAIAEYSGVTVDTDRITRHRDEAGIGAIVQMDSNAIISCGSIELMEKLGVGGEKSSGLGVSAYVAVGKTYVGRIDFDDSVRAGARETVSQLRKLGVANVALITGDNSISATNIGREVGITEIYADCLPKDKYERVQYIVRSQERDDKLAFVVGAGSDIPAMRLANVGISLGEGNSSAKLTVASGEVIKVPTAIKIAREIRNSNIRAYAILFGAKLISVILGLLGVIPMACVLILDAAALIVTGFLAKKLLKA